MASSRIRRATALPPLRNHQTNTMDLVTSATTVAASKVRARSVAKRRNENVVTAMCGRGLTRHKISDRWRGRVWLLVECGSNPKLERGAASGSLHHLVRWTRGLHENRSHYSLPLQIRISP